MRIRPPSTPPFSDCRTSTASWLGWAPTARSSPTTSAESLSGPAISRVAPSNSPGSSKRRGGAGTNEQIPRILPRQGRFIGVVLIILVIAIGLQPERLMSWATALRYQALFTEAGGLTVGNDVTVSGIKVGVGLVDRTRERRCAGRFHDRRQVRARLGHHGAHPHRHPARRAGAGAGVRRQRHVVAERGHPGVTGRRRRIR